MYRLCMHKKSHSVPAIPIPFFHVYVCVSITSVCCMLLSKCLYPKAMPIVPYISESIWAMPLAAETGTRPVKAALPYRAFSHRRYCGKIFPRSANLTRHLRTHTGEQPYRYSSPLRVSVVVRVVRWIKQRSTSSTALLVNSPWTLAMVLPLTSVNFGVRHHCRCEVHVPMAKQLTLQFPRGCCPVKVGAWATTAPASLPHLW